jgi:hypothetical protein
LQSKATLANRSFGRVIDDAIDRIDRKAD